MMMILLHSRDQRNQPIVFDTVHATLGYRVRLLLVNSPWHKLCVER